MPGGSLDYRYSQIEFLADEIQAYKLVFNVDDPLTDKEKKILKKGVKQLTADLRIIAARAKDLEWWLSGNFGDKTYFDIIQKEKE